MKIADLRKMLVRSSINEVNIPEIRIGMPVQIQLDAIPNQVYQGTVTSISPQGEKEDNIVTYTVTIEINQADEQLRPAMTANVDILTRTLENVLFLPLEAIVYEGDKAFVYLLDPHGEPIKRPVRIEQKTQQVAIIKEGLRQGEVVLDPSSISVSS